MKISWLNYCALGMVAFITACTANIAPQEWQAVQQSNKIVWADDGSEVVYAELHYEEAESGFFNKTIERDRFKHRLYTQAADGSNRQNVTQLRAGRNGALFYMKQMGYFVAESFLDNGAKQFYKILPNGNEILIMEVPPDAQNPCGMEAQSAAQVYNIVIPSPNGQVLAHVYSPECQQATVEFLYANNLNIIDSQTIDIDEPMSALWHPDGYLILTNADNNKAWRVGVQESIMLTEAPACVAPMTTSSNISMDGVMVYFAEDGTLATQTVGIHQAFGCNLSEAEQQS